FASGTRSEEEIVRLMIGRDITQVYPPKPQRGAVPAPCLEVSGLTWGERLSDLSFSVGKGEIVGLGGLDGQGQRELMLALFGVMRGVEGKLSLEGKPYQPSGPAHAK